MDWDRLLTTTLFGNDISEWALAALAGLLTWLGLFGIRLLVRRYFTALAAKTETRLDDALVQVLKRTRWYFYVAAAVYAASSFLVLSPKVDKWVDRGVFLAMLLQLGLWASSAVRAGVDFWMQSREAPAGQASTFVSATRFGANVVIWSLVIVFVLGNLGVEISALIAGLGVGGIAVALAAQSIFGDLFASIAIFLDRPFDIGDFIIVDNMQGTVEKVGLRSSRIRSTTGEELILPNRSLVEARIKNMKRLQERRFTFKLGIVYGTAAEKLERIPQLIEEAVSRRERLTFERCHFIQYGEFSLVFETSLTIDSGDNIEYLKAQHALFLDIYRTFEKERIQFAFPTQTVHLHQATATTA